MWYTTDGGDSYTKINGIKRSDVVGFGKAKDGADYLAVYAVCEIEGVNAVYRSDDMGKSWIRINDDKHQYGSINYAITGDLRVYGRVFVATNGRGIVYGDLVDEVEKTTEVEGKIPVLTTTERTELEKATVPIWAMLIAMAMLIVLILLLLSAVFLTRRK